MSTHSKKLAGKVAVVTGGAKGIGAGIARALAAEGAAVVVNYARSKEGAERVVEEIVKEGGMAMAVQGDVARRGDIERLFMEMKGAYGGLDILVNNAGIYEFARLEEITEEHFHRHYDLNVLGVLLMTQEALRYFGEGGGSVINISSIASTLAPTEAAVYAGTKASVDAMTKVLAKELGGRRIRVNAINPGVVETEGLLASGLTEEGFRERVEERTPLGRLGRPGDIGAAAVFLASEEASWITGETLVVSGGLY